VEARRTRRRVTWCAQRFTAIALGAADGLVPGVAVVAPNLGYGAVRHWVAAADGGALSLLVVALCWHSRLGVQVVIEDYVHHRGINAATLMLSALLHVLFGAAALLSVLRIAVGDM
jgi:succinate dehydrogenase / fumarate reductase membrane anchor subunit